jgi:transcriptional regulator with XRE-family HTH domain
MANYLRSHRLKSGFSRRELAEIVGLLTETQVGRHERLHTIPSLMAALSYQAVFRVSVAELFPGIYETVAQGIEERLLAIESTLQDSSARARGAHITARKLEWLNERKDPAPHDSTE